MLSQPTLVGLLSLSLLFSTPTNARGLNDWSKPCFDGECAYDLPDNDGQSAGTLKIESPLFLSFAGSPNAISDITSAAGWTILDCSSTALTQDIRLVCSTDEAEASCNHLFKKNGAVGKLVRLPETCGKSAFARVAQYSVSKDQSIPKSVSHNISRRSNAKPLVISLHLDTNFAAIDPSAYGDVSIAIQGTTIPGAPGNFTVVPANERRGIFDFIENAFNDFNNIDLSKSGDITALNIDKDFPIYSNSFSCTGPPSFTASIDVDVDTTAKVVISFGVAAVGTIIPPKLTEFGLFAALDASLDAILGVKGNVAGTASTGEVTLYSYALPGLDFPGILTLGPTFKIVGELSAEFDADIDLTAELSYSITSARIVYPRAANTASSGTYTPSSGPLKLSVNGNEASSATVNVLVSPRIDIGLDALDGIATATAYLHFDATASATIDLNTSGSASATVNITTGTVTDTAAGSVNGCVTVDAGVSASVGADASFFGLFDKSGTLSLFNKDWELYSKCFANSAGVARRSVEGRAGLSLSCPSTPASALLKLA